MVEVLHEYFKEGTTHRPELYKQRKGKKGNVVEK
jgi:hypothetical protein